MAAQVNLAYANIEASALLPMWIVVIAALLCVADLHRRKERLLLANLGISTSWAVCVATLPAVALEAMLTMAR